MNVHIYILQVVEENSSYFSSQFHHPQENANRYCRNLCSLVFIYLFALTDLSEEFCKMFVIIAFAYSLKMIARKRKTSECSLNKLITIC